MTEIMEMVFRLAAVILLAVAAGNLWTFRFFSG